MIIVFIATAFGCAFAFRICALALERKVSSRATLIRIGTVGALLSALTIATFARTRTQAWMLAVAPALALLAHFAIERARRESRFRSELYGFLNACILRMKSGEAFRPALDGAIEDADPRARPRLRELRDVVVFSQQSPECGAVRAKVFGRTLALAARELALADRDSHSATRRCSALRDRVRLEDEFRRKSGQASRQARAQSLVLAGLYLATFAFVGHHFGIAKNLRLLGASALLFATGLFWTQTTGRKLKWKT